jgi:Ribbon-helix-helix domain
MLNIGRQLRILTVMKQSHKRRMEFWIRKDQHASLLVRYERLGVPIAEQIRRAIDEYLRKHGRLSSTKRSEKNAKQTNGSED